MGKVEVAAPNSLECIESRLARFALQQPKNSQAIYLYAMALWKRQSQAPDPQVLQQVESLLTKAVNIDAKCSDGYLQLGILRSSQRDFAGAIVFYTKAIESNPQLGEAHYRLGVAYDRIGESARAKQEFQLHDQIEKQQAAAIEEQRREVKQFQFAPQSQPIPPPSH
jgi:tetratricopeptide (TPR) repeat protein